MKPAWNCKAGKSKQSVLAVPTLATAMPTCATAKSFIGAQITPLIQASTHVVANDRRTRKLLLHRRQIDTLIGRVQREGFTLVPTAMYWSKNRVKMEIALAKGKQAHDKRHAEKEREWQRDKQRIMRAHNRNA